MEISPSHMQAWRTFLRAHARVLRELEQELADEQGIAISWYDMLVQLQEAGGTMRMGELASEMLISRSATTRFVDRVEAAGFVERSASVEDGRGMNVRLTDAGLTRLRAASPTHLRGVAEHFASRLSDDDVHALDRILDKLV